MKIKLSTSICGNGFAHHVGEVIDWPDAEARRFIAAGMASSAEYRPAPAPSGPKKHKKNVAGRPVEMATAATATETETR